MAEVNVSEWWVLSVIGRGNKCKCRKCGSRPGSRSSSPLSLRLERSVWLWLTLAHFPPLMSLAFILGLATDNSIRSPVSNCFVVPTFFHRNGNCFLAQNNTKSFSIRNCNNRIGLGSKCCFCLRSKHFLFLSICILKKQTTKQSLAVKLVL